MVLVTDVNHVEDPGGGEAGQERDEEAEEGHHDQKSPSSCTVVK